MNRFWTDDTKTILIYHYGELVATVSKGAISTLPGFEIRTISKHLYEDEEDYSRNMVEKARQEAVERKKARQKRNAEPKD